MSLKIKKLVCVVLGILILLSVTACGSQTNNSTDTSAKAGTTAATTAETTAAKPDPFGKYTPGITVNTVRVLDAATKFEPGNPIRDSITKNVWATAYEEQLGIKFNYQWTTTSGPLYTEKWNVVIASGDLPDMAVVDAVIYPMLVKNGYVEDMTQIYNDYASDVYKQCNIDDDGLLMKYSTFEGKLMGLPHSGETPDKIPMMFIRNDWLKKVNMAAPKTIDELIAVAKAFKDAKLGGPQTYGLVMSKVIPTGLNDDLGFFNGFGAYYNIWLKDKSDKLVYSNVQPEMRNALLKLQLMYKAGLLAQDFAVMDWAKAGEDVVASKVGIAYGSFAYPLISIQSNMQKDPEADWLVLPIPTEDGSEPKPQTYMAQVNNFVFVRKGYEHPEAAVKLINLTMKLTSEEYDKYMNPKDGYQIHFYRFAAAMGVPFNLTKAHLAIIDALKTGDTSKLKPDQIVNYERVKKGVEGDRNDALWMVLGTEPNSTFAVTGKFWEARNIVVNAFQALPTETFLTKGGTLNNNLEAAIFKVIMGEDISAFDKAAQEWHDMGGDVITKEVNDWYSKNK